MDKIEKLEYENAMLRDKLDKEKGIVQRLENWSSNAAINEMIISGKVSVNPPALYNRFQNRLADFADRYSKIYIYGAGKKAARISNELIKYGIDFEGYLVSPGESIKFDSFNHPVYHVNEVKLNGNVGVIIALNRQNTINAIAHIIDAKIGAIFLAE